ncbi:hypothetical protein HRbin19_00139 [bacterium HR19]|nr:hypothetical protein HRbin19_00139 [bacterium HR19]
MIQEISAKKLKKIKNQGQVLSVFDNMESLKKLSLLFGILFSSIIPSQKVKSDIGLGIMLGDPTGISGKLWIKEKDAVSLGASWSVIRERLTLLGSYNREIEIKTEIKEGKLFFYPGVGVFVGIPSSFGVYIPLGLDFNFNKAPINIFFEIDPGTKILPETSFSIFGYIGARYIFK